MWPYGGHWGSEIEPEPPRKSGGTAKKVAFLLLVAGFALAVLWAYSSS